MVWLNLDKSKKFPYTVTVLWEYNDSDQKWNDLCAWTVETFGLPGDKFQWHAQTAYMMWNFTLEQDALLFLVRSGGRPTWLETEK